jgi:hypothetical protein
MFENSMLRGIFGLKRKGVAGPSIRATRDVGPDRFDPEVMVRIPVKTWMFALVFLCCVVLYR